MQDSDAYNHVETGTAKKLELDMVKQNARDMLQSLQEKTAVQREIQEKELKNMRADTFAKFFMGSKVDYLQSKFITTLKKKAMERKDEAIQAQNEQLIAQILKK